MQKFVFEKVKSLQEWLGLSDNGLRLYEKEGVIHPKINEANGYREMSITEGTLMSIGLVFTKYGITIRETAELMRMDIGQQTQYLEEVGRRTKQELLNKYFIMDYLSEQLTLLREYTANPLSCRVTSSKQAFFLPMHDSNLAALAGRPDSAQWAKNKPFSTGAMVIPLAENTGGQKEEVYHLIGPAMWASDAERLRVPLKSAMCLGAESMQCVQAFVMTEIHFFGERASYNHICRFMKEQNLKICGNSLLRTITCEKRGGHSYQCTEIRIPVLPC